MPAHRSLVYEALMAVHIVTGLSFAAIQDGFVTTVSAFGSVAVQEQSPLTVRRLTDAQGEAIRALCEKDPEYNVFFLANLDKLKGGQDLVEYWGQIDSSGVLVAVLMRYNTLWYTYDTRGADVQAFADIIDEKGQSKIVINDNVKSTGGLAAKLTNYRKDRIITGRLRRLEAQQASDSLTRGEARKAIADDIDRLSRFYAEAPDDVRRGRESVRRSIGGERRTYLLEKDSSIVAAGLTTAELPTFAMLGGVHVIAHSDRLAYLRAILSELVRSLLSEEKHILIVTREPMIDATCTALGFEDIGPWRIVFFSRIETH